MLFFGLLVYANALLSQSSPIRTYVPLASGIRVTECHTAGPTYILRQVGSDGHSTFRFVDEGAESWDKISSLVQTSPDELVSMDVYAPVEEGFGAATTLNDRFRVVWFGNPFPQSDADTAREMFAARIETYGNKEQADRIRHNTTRRALPLGYVVNVVGVLLIGLFFWSCGWVLDLRSLRRDSRLRQGLCGKCAYDLSGTDSNADGMAMCPECGTLNPRAASA